MSRSYFAHRASEDPEGYARCFRRQSGIASMKAGVSQKRRTGPRRSAVRSALSPEPRTPWWQLDPNATFLVLSALWVALLYGRAVAAPFVYDDVPAIQHNPHLSSWQDIPQYFRSPIDLNNEFRGHAGSIYRPLTWFGFIVNRRLSGADPAGFHLGNLIFHWANGAICFLLLRKLRISSLVAGMSCLIWLGLPINTEAVAWISGRHVCQAAFFILASLLAALAYLQTRKILFLLGYGLALMAALLSIEWAIVALPLTALLVYFENSKERSMWFALGASGLAATLIQVAMRSWAGAALPLGSLKIFPVGLSFWKYVGWMLLPVRMSVERSTDSPANAFTLASIIALLAMVCFLVLLGTGLRKWSPGAAGGLLWMFLCLLPFCGVVFIYQGMAERYCYLASAGLAFAVVALVDRLPGRRLSSIGKSVLVLWVLWGAWRLNARVVDWGDEETLFESSLAVNPRSQILLYDLGVKAADSGDVPSAIAYYRRALEVNPNYVNVLVNLSNLLRNQGTYSAAIDLEKRALSVEPRSAELWVNLGNSYLREGLAEQAIRSYQQALSLNTNNVEANINLGAAFQSQGNLAAAQERYRRAIAIDPHQGAGYCDLGALLLKKGDIHGAIDQFNKAVEHDDSYFQAYFDLGLVYESIGQEQVAIVMFDRVLQLKPDNAQAAEHLRRLQRLR